jgi:tetratricopeptide (TPR) repeat protein
MRFLLNKVIRLLAAIYDGAVLLLRRLLPQTWQTLPSYLPFYLLLIVVCYAGWKGTNSVTVVSPFHTPGQAALPFSAETVADTLQDAMNTIFSETDSATVQQTKAPKQVSAFVPAELEESSMSALATAAPNFTRAQSPTTFAPEVKGLSYDGILSTARSILGTETNIYGDVIVESNELILVVRSKDQGPWESHSFPKTFEGLKRASRDVAEQILTTLDPTAAGIALNRDGNLTASIGAFLRAASRSPKDPAAQLNLCNAYKVAERYDEALDCFHAHQMGLLQESGGQGGISLSAKLHMDGDYDEANKAIEEVIQAAPPWYERILRGDRRYLEAMRGLAPTLASMGRNGLAIKAYQRLLALDPSKRGQAFAHNNIGAPYESLHQYDDAIKSFTLSLEEQPRDPLAGINLALQTLHKGDLNGSIVQMRAVLKANPHFAFGIDRLGDLLLQNKDIEGATSEFQLALVEGPGYPKAHQDLARALALQHRFKEALAEYDKANALDPHFRDIALNPGSRSKNFIKSQDYIDLAAGLPIGDRKIAIEQYRKAVALNEDYAPAHFKLGVALGADKSTQPEAIAEYKKAITLKTNFAGPHLALGNLLQTQGSKDAPAEWREAISINPDQDNDNAFYVAESHASLSNYLAGAAGGEKTEDAIIEGRKAVALGDAEPYTHLVLASALDDEGSKNPKSYTEAIDEYRIALRLDPKYADAHNDLAVTYRNLTDFDSAITEFGIAFKIDPKNARYRRNLAVTHRMYGELFVTHGAVEKAIAQFREAVDVMPEDAAAQNSLAWQLVTSKNFADPVSGLEHARRAVELSGGRQPDYLDTMAAAYYANGRVEDAIQAETRALSFDPTRKLFSDSLAKYRGVAPTR